MKQPPNPSLPPLGREPDLSHAQGGQKPPFPPMQGMPNGMTPPPAMGKNGFASAPPADGWTPPMADIAWVKRKSLDVPYDSASDAQKLDLYFPDAGDGPFPALIHIHGGGFAFGDKRDSHMNAYLDGVRRGYVVGSVAYRLSGEAIFPAAVLDVRQAIRFLRKHAAEYRIDPQRIAVIGGSAGGNLVAMLAMNIENGAFYGEAPAETFDTNPFVQTAIDQFGPTDFKPMDAQARANGVSFADHDRPDSAESMYIGTPLPDADEALCQKANPASYISKRMCPLLIQHGRMDRLVPFAQSEELFHAIVHQLGEGRATFVPLDTADHEDRQFTEPKNMAVVWAFLEQHLQ